MYLNYNTIYSKNTIDALYEAFMKQGDGTKHDINH